MAFVAVSFRYNIYSQRAEDTFILLDALEEDADDLRKMSSAICVEIGYADSSFISSLTKYIARCGSGCVSAFTGKILGSSASRTRTSCTPRPP